MRYLLVACSAALTAVSLLACGGGAKPSPTVTPAATAIAGPTATAVVPTEEPGVAAIIAAIRVDLATRLSEAEVSNMDVISITRHDWPDSCLGLPRPTEECAQVITPGYEIWLGTPIGNTYVYRAAAPENVRFDKVYLEG